MSITDLVDFYREQGMDDQAINEQIPRDLDAQRADLIDMRRYER